VTWNVPVGRLPLACMISLLPLRPVRAPTMKMRRHQAPPGVTTYDASPDSTVCRAAENSCANTRSAGSISVILSRRRGTAISTRTPGVSFHSIFTLTPLKRITGGEGRSFYDARAPTSMQMEGNHTIWIEKYRPRRLDEMVGQQDIVVRLQSYVRTGNLPHLLFTGSAGIGKTTAAVALARELFGDSWADELPGDERIR